MTSHERFVPVLRRLVDPLNPDPAVTLEAQHAIGWALGRIEAARQRDEATETAATLRHHADQLAAALEFVTAEGPHEKDPPKGCLCRWCEARRLVAAWREGPGARSKGQGEG